MIEMAIIPFGTKARAHRGVVTVCRMPEDRGPSPRGRPEAELGEAVFLPSQAGGSTAD